jgi:hypothetical protein
VSRIVRLTLLAPEIVEAILEGRQPAELQLDDLLDGFPLEWERQREHWASKDPSVRGPRVSQGAIDALELDLTPFGGRDDARDAPVYVLAKEDLPRLGAALDPRGHVHHRAGDGEFLAVPADLADRGLSGMNADTDAERGAAALQPRSL